jgi:hypothetical protein
MRLMGGTREDLTLVPSPEWRGRIIRLSAFQPHRHDIMVDTDSKKTQSPSKVIISIFKLRRSGIANKEIFLPEGVAGIDILDMRCSKISYCS